MLDHRGTTRGDKIWQVAYVLILGHSWRQASFHASELPLTGGQRALESYDVHGSNGPSSREFLERKPQDMPDSGNETQEGEFKVEKGVCGDPMNVKWYVHGEERC